MGLTKFVLKRPVTTVMALLCLLVFGISSVFSATLEQMPDMETPMMIVSARYEGAGPEDIEELVTQPIEDAVSTLEGVKSVSSSSSDGSSMVMLEYDYGTDMDEACLLYTSPVQVSFSPFFNRSVKPNCFAFVERMSKNVTS